MAASATFALKAGEWFRRGRLFMLSPDSRAACPLSGRNSTYRPVQILEAGSDYFGAVEAFEAAHKIDPMDDPITRNLGDSYVEVGRLNVAFVVYSGLKNKNALWNYKVARVKYYQGLLDDALTLVKKVPSDLAEDGGLLGRPRILEAAILLDRFKAASESQQEMLIDARDKFKNGVEFDPQHWQHIFKVNHRTKYETFDRQFETLEPYLSEWL